MVVYRAQWRERNILNPLVENVIDTFVIVTVDPGTEAVTFDFTEDRANAFATEDARLAQGLTSASLTGPQFLTRINFLRGQAGQGNLITGVDAWEQQTRPFSLDEGLITPLTEDQKDLLIGLVVMGVLLGIIGIEAIRFIMRRTST